jgi:hypothetical protein
MDFPKPNVPAAPQAGALPSCDWNAGNDAQSTEPVTIGLPWSRLKGFRDRLSAMSLPHDLVLPYLLFLGGLRQASCVPVPVPTSNPSAATLELMGHATLSLRDAVEFSLQEQAQSLAKSLSGIAGDTAFQCLFMGVAYAQSNHTPDVHAWLMRGSFDHNLTRLLDAMGVLAWTLPQARRLTTRIVPHFSALVLENFGPGVARHFEMLNGTDSQILRA